MFASVVAVGAVVGKFIRYRVFASFASFAVGGVNAAV
jgi:hypothetical protein